MTAKELYRYAVKEATAVVGKVEVEMLELPTPDTEWRVHELLQHMLYELAWTSDIVQGRTIAEVGDKYEQLVMSSEPSEVWQEYAAQTLAAVAACDETGVAHLSYGDKTINDYLLEAGNDQLIHAWDLGQAIGVDVHFDEQVAAQLYAQFLARQEELLGSGLFGTPVVTPQDASVQRKLLGLLGRSEAWRRTL